MDTFICGSCNQQYNDIQDFIVHKNQGCPELPPNIQNVQKINVTTESADSAEQISVLHVLGDNQVITIDSNELASLTDENQTLYVVTESDNQELAKQETVQVIRQQPNEEQTSQPTAIPSTTGKKRGRPRKGMEKNRKPEVETREKKQDTKPSVPERGKDGKYHCTQCKKEFTKERCFVAHKCLAQTDYVDISKKSGLDPDMDELGGDDDDQSDDEIVRGSYDGDKDYTEPRITALKLGTKRRFDYIDTYTATAVNNDEPNAETTESKKTEETKPEEKSTIDSVEVSANIDGEENLEKPTDLIDDIPVFRTEEEKIAFEESLNIDLTELDYLFKVHVISQDLNEHATCTPRHTSMALNIYSCEVCEKIFKTVSHMRLHCLIHTDLKPFKCPTCDYSSNSKGNLYTHMRKHTGQYYKCGKCDFKSVNKSHVVEHEATHANLRHKCEICKKDYNTVKSLINHIRKYHGNIKRGKDYLQTFLQGRQQRGTTVIHQCHVCNRKFKKKVDRDRHLFVHDIKDIPSVQHCELCDYSASRRIYLEKHYSKHRAIYQCVCCSERFLSSVRLIDHLTSAHADDDSVNKCDDLFEQCINNSLYLPEPDDSLDQGDKEFVNLPPELSLVKLTNTDESKDGTNGIGISNEELQSAEDFVDSMLSKPVPLQPSTLGTDKEPQDSITENHVIEQNKKVDNENEICDNENERQSGELLNEKTGALFLNNNNGIQDDVIQTEKSNDVCMEGDSVNSNEEKNSLTHIQASCSDSCEIIASSSSSAPSVGVNTVEHSNADPVKASSSDNSVPMETDETPADASKNEIDTSECLRTEVDDGKVVDIIEADDNDPDLQQIKQAFSTTENTPIQSNEDSLTDDLKPDDENSPRPQIEFINKLGYRPLNMQIFQKMRETFGTEECEFCGRLFYKKIDYDTHMRTHTGDKPFTCAACGYRSITKDNLKRHMERQHEDALFPCKECDFVAISRSQLWNHNLKHKGLTEPECPECKKRFESLKKLRNHMITKHEGMSREEIEKATGYKHRIQGKMGRRSYKCPYCKKVFIRASSELQKHIWIHEGIKPYKCQLCPHACRSKNNLQAHMLRHSAEKPFLCGDCGKAYKSKTALRWHVRSHRDGKLFKCDRCPYEATQRSHLKRHMETHEIIKRYVCNLCEYSANTIGYMKIHYTRNHKGEQYTLTNPSVDQSVGATSDSRVYKCLSCDYLFGNLTDLKRHLKIRHHVQMQDIPVLENVPLSEVQVVQDDNIVPVMQKTPDETSTGVTIQEVETTAMEESNQLDEKTASAVNILQQIIDISNQGNFGQQQVSLLSDDGQMVTVNPDTIIVQQSGEEVLLTDGAQVTEASQLVIQYIDPSNDQLSVDSIPMEVHTTDVVDDPTVTLQDAPS